MKLKSSKRVFNRKCVFIWGISCQKNGRAVPYGLVCLTGYEIEYIAKGAKYSVFG